MPYRVPRFTILGKSKAKIWTPGVMRPEFARHIVPQLRRLIALWEIPGLSVKRYAELCGLEPGEFFYLNRAIRTEYAFTQFSAIRFCLEHGLPASAWVEFPELRTEPRKRTRVPIVSQNIMSAPNRMSVTCPSCGMKVHGLPCVRCRCGPDDDPESMVARQDEHEPVLQEPCPTDFPPGSLGKFGVLCERAANNQELWHPLDNKSPVPCSLTASGPDSVSDSLWELSN
jgi:hypothetical protein